MVIKQPLLSRSRNECRRQHECGKYREEGKHGYFRSPQQDTALSWGLRDLENTTQCSRMGKAIRPREKLMQRLGTKEATSSVRRGEWRDEAREVGQGHILSASPPDSAHGSRLPHKWLWDIKEACVLLEPEDSELFPAHLSG